jgi:glucose/arabinose dehydrogenase
MAAFAESAGASGYSLRFHGNGTGDIDRVKIRVDDPSNSLPGPPADVGATDFTVEFWMKANAAENTAPSVACGANVNWRFGNVVVDRDRYNQDRKFGVAIGDGRLVFGVSGQGTGDRTVCGSTNVLDNQWHQIAVERRRSDGFMWLFVDGVLEAAADGPDGDVSYPDDGVPGDFCGGPCTNSDPFLVFGAEKHDAGPQYPSYGGFLDEVRLSKVLRYGSNFTRPSQPFTADADTAALYHFDEGSGDANGDSSGASGGPSNGERRFGGSPAGPEWSHDVAPLGAVPALALVPVATGLANPVAVTHAGDGSGRLFITLQGGKIVIFDGSQVLASPFLDIHTLVSCCGERGLLSVAFHPSYTGNGYFFVNYTDTNGDTVIARYRVSPDPNVADPTSALVLLTIAQPFANHNGGQLQFGPDGYLYVGMGDGGSGGDPGDRAQNLGELLGKMLRIDISGSTSYGIPPTNPFVSNPSARPEIWAYGLRNPWRFSFDRRTGDLFIADVGQGSWEEIDFQPASSGGGQNYGWRLMEGTHCYNPASNCNDGTLTLPILDYGHVPGDCAVVGGYRYRGTAAPQLHGLYLYGDFCSGRIWGASQGGDGLWSATELLQGPFLIGSFGEDQQGEIYVAGYSANATLYRLVGAPTVTGINPPSGSGAGGTPVTISGTNFQSGALVSIGGATPSSVAIVDSHTITAVTGAHAPSTVDVMVTTAAGSATMTGGYTYVCMPPDPPVLTAPGTATSGLAYTVSWTATSTDGTYELEESNDASFTSATAYAVAGTNQSFGHAVASDTTYYSRARAKVMCGGSPYYSSWSNTGQTVVSPPGGCSLTLSSQTITTAQAYTSCGTLTAGPAFRVEAPGDVTLRAATSVILANGFSVGTGAAFTAGLDSSLAGP